MSNSILKNSGLVRTDMYCHDCNKNFIAEVDYDIEGEHIIECPHCHHEHCRVVKDGNITSDRWDGRNSNNKTRAATFPTQWKHNSLKVQSSTASIFIRDKWLNFGGGV